MKKLLFQFDTDAYPAVFDTVVAYDGGADHVIGHGGLAPDTVKPLVEGTIFTRAPQEKKNTAIFLGGSNMADGQNLLSAIRKMFFANFRVSIMLDSNGCNTTAAAGVAKLAASAALGGKRAVVLAGTGPVGRRTAFMLAKSGCEVSLTSRRMQRAENACNEIKKRFDVEITPLEALSSDARGEAIQDAQVIFATGAAGVELLEERHWKDNANIETMADANATPSIGIAGTDTVDRGNERHGKIIWGAIGFGTLKIALHRACIAKLFERNDQVFDAEEIFEIAKTMA